MGTTLDNNSLDKLHNCDLSWYAYLEDPNTFVFLLKSPHLARTGCLVCSMYYVNMPSVIHGAYFRLADPSEVTTLLDKLPLNHRSYFLPNCYYKVHCDEGEFDLYADVHKLTWDTNRLLEFSAEICQEHAPEGYESFFQKFEEKLEFI